MITISIDQLAEAIQNMAGEYAASVRQAVSESAKESAKEAKKSLKKTSPKRTGAYGKGWTYKVRRGIGGEPDSYIVYNEKYYRLTHLLEYGHANASGTERTPAKPHIKAAEEEIQSDFVDKVVRGISEIG